MKYTDADGKLREIAIPKGKAKEAGAYYEANNFTDLAAYPTWEG
jgi:hypothetical protein